MEIFSRKITNIEHRRLIVNVYIQAQIEIVLEYIRIVVQSQVKGEFTLEIDSKQIHTTCFDSGKRVIIRYDR